MQDFEPQKLKIHFQHQARSTLLSSHWGFRQYEKNSNKESDSKRGEFYLEDLFGQVLTMVSGIAAPGACTRPILFEFLTYPHFVGKACVDAHTRLTLLERA
ncbi:MAG: hypothetical protein QNL48_03125 [Alcaligenes aquatilis]